MTYPQFPKIFKQNIKAFFAHELVNHVKTQYKRLEQSFLDWTNAKAINQYLGAESYKQLCEWLTIAS